MKKIKEKLKEYWKNNPKKRKSIMFVAVVFGGMVSFGLYALAQSMIDSFTDSSRIANTWNVNVDTGAGEVKLAAKTCDDGTWFCSLNTTCANSLGDGAYIIVKRVNEATTKQWKTANTNCDKPNCGRDVCKAAGGRLPTKTELQCLYTNRATFGNNFGTSFYWSSTEYSTTSAWNVNFNDGYTDYFNKTNAYSVRCVRGW